MLYEYGGTAHACLGVNEATVPEQLVSVASQICEMRGSPSFIVHTAASYTQQGASVVCFKKLTVCNLL